MPFNIRYMLDVLPDHDWNWQKMVSEKMPKCQAEAIIKLTAAANNGKSSPWTVDNVNEPNKGIAYNDSKMMVETKLSGNKVQPADTKESSTLWLISGTRHIIITHVVAPDMTTIIKQSFTVTVAGSSYTLTAALLVRAEFTPV